MSRWKRGVTGEVENNKVGVKGEGVQKVENTVLVEAGTNVALRQRVMVLRQ